MRMKPFAKVLKVQKKKYKKILSKQKDNKREKEQNTTKKKETRRGRLRRRIVESILCMYLQKGRMPARILHVATPSSAPKIQKKWRSLAAFPLRVSPALKRKMASITSRRL